MESNKIEPVERYWTSQEAETAHKALYQLYQKADEKRLSAIAEARQEDVVEVDRAWRKLLGFYVSEMAKLVGLYTRSVHKTAD